MSGSRERAKKLLVHYLSRTDAGPITGEEVAEIESIVDEIVDALSGEFHGFEARLEEFQIRIGARVGSLAIDDLNILEAARASNVQITEAIDGERERIAVLEAAQSDDFVRTDELVRSLESLRCRVAKNENLRFRSDEDIRSDLEDLERRQSIHDRDVDENLEELLARVRSLEAVHS